MGWDTTDDERNGITDGPSHSLRWLAHAHAPMHSLTNHNRSLQIYVNTILLIM